jgi:predicted dehydrogenase
VDKVRLALVGCGKVGRIHASALGELPESEFVAACDPQRERAEAFGAVGETIAKSRNSATASTRDLFIVRGDVRDTRMTHLRTWLKGRPSRPQGGGTG